jgi:signal transduction histidine kinase
MLGVPLVTKGEVIGVLAAINKRDGDRYGQRDVALLLMLASQAAVAIENARLFQQTDFIAELMHELKTPLMALTAASELLARDDMLDRRSELVAMIQRETTRLSKMTQDFLDLARLESGRAQLNRETVDLCKLVRDVVRLQEPQATAGEIVIAVDIPDTLPVVMGDYNRLKQVLLNLTSNAIKYNVIHGSVTIVARELGDEVVIKISDTGPGITPENLPHLFDRFYRIPDSEGFTKGTGLGLFITARILQEHGGRIEADSVLGQGSTFSCYLPVYSP